MRSRHILIVLAMTLFGCVIAFGQPDDLARARSLAFDGHRAEALAVLEHYMRDKPNDTDALTFYGIVLSWEGRYEEARKALRAVLKRYPDHGDALPALINVELWSGNSAYAEELTATAIVNRPKDEALLMARARALKRLGRSREALGLLDQVLELNPLQKQALAMRDDLRENLRHWEAAADQSYEWFNDGRAAWNETALSLKRQTEVAGSVIVRFSHADRFSLSSKMVEVDAYPSIRKGTYAYLNIGWSPDAVLYSHYRLGAELFQSLPYGMEISGGLRRLGFSSPVNVYTGSLSKYFGDWYFGARTYVTPGSAGDSESMQFFTRRYFGDGGSYLGVRYGFGAAPVEQGSLNEIEVLRSQSVLGEINWRMARRWTVNFRAGHSVEDRIGFSGLHHELVDGAFYFRF